MIEYVCAPGEHQLSNGVICLEKYGDIAMWALPTTAGIQLLSQGRIVTSLGLIVFGLLQDQFVGFLKKSLPKQRPCPFYLNQVSLKDKESFPSSHTAGAFLAVGLALGTGSAYTITTVALASLVGLSRYLSHKHWPLDIFAGAAIGLLNGYLIAQIG